MDISFVNTFTVGVKHYAVQYVV